MAAILALFGQRPRLNGLYFLAGWVAGLMVLTLFIVYFVDLSRTSLAGKWQPVADFVKLSFGVIFLILAAVQWRRRPKAGEEQTLPAWTARIEAFSPWQALVVAIGLCVINPKNLVLTLVTVLALTAANAPAWQNWLGLTVYIGLGSVTIATPVLYRIWAGAKADANLAEAKQWLQANSTTVMAVVFVLLAALLLGKGVEGIL